MGRSRHTEKLMGANQDRKSWSVYPEVLRTSGGANVPAVVALRAPLRQTQLSCLEPSGYLDSGLMYRIADVTSDPARAPPHVIIAVVRHVKCGIEVRS